jgi:hypothetical protein
MIVWSLKLTSNHIIAMRKIADAEIDGSEFSGPSRWHTTFKPLLDHRLAIAKDANRKPNSSGGTPAKYKLTDLGVAVLNVIDVELESLR